MKRTRRELMQQGGQYLAAAGAAAAFGRSARAEQKEAIDARKYLSRIVYSRQEVDDWFAGRDFKFAQYDGELGWLLKDARFKDGVDGSVSNYRYVDGGKHERRMMAHADQPCRINTYGNSFTMCHQVNDGETWQEVLASHLYEPVRNFGVGAWSVYQAYLRMLQEEQRVPAKLIILNIYDDDHYRNLDAWRHIRCGKDDRFLCPTLPYLRVDPETKQAARMPNPCPTKESFYNLCDLDWVVDRFKDDFVLKIMLAHANARRGNPDQAYETIMDMAKTHGINTRIDRSRTTDHVAREYHANVALTASMRIVEWVEEFAAKHDKKVLYVLSFNAANVARRIEHGTRFDTPFLEFLEERKLPFVDLMDAHLRDYAEFKVDPKRYLERYYIGHYTPMGNFFTAHAIKDKVVEMLDPKPASYRWP